MCVLQVFVCIGKKDSLMGCAVLEGRAGAAQMQTSSAASRTVADGDSSKTPQQQQDVGRAPAPTCPNNVEAVGRAADGLDDQHAAGVRPRRAAGSRPSLLTEWLIRTAGPVSSASQMQPGTWSHGEAQGLAAETCRTSAPTDNCYAVSHAVRLLWVITDRRRENITARLLDIGRLSGVGPSW